MPDHKHEEQESMTFTFERDGHPQITTIRERDLRAALTYHEYNQDWYFIYVADQEGPFQVSKESYERAANVLEREESERSQECKLNG